MALGMVSWVHDSFHTPLFVPKYVCNFAGMLARGEIDAGGTLLYHENSDEPKVADYSLPVGITYGGFVFKTPSSSSRNSILGVFQGAKNCQTLLALENTFFSVSMASLGLYHVQSFLRSADKICNLRNFKKKQKNFRQKRKQYYGRNTSFVFNISNHLLPIGSHHSFYRRACPNLSLQQL